MSAIRNRYDFVYLFDVTDGNPNGDPDAGNLPRLDPETHQGLVTDVCLKRKVRNYVTLAKASEPGYRIFVAERAILEHRQGEAWDAVMGARTTAAAQNRAKLPRDEAKARALIEWMCANFYDVRTFGAVMSTSGANCGQVRGPVQLTFARSVEPVLPLEVAITRMAVTTAADAESKGDIRTMGRKYIVPYGLYRTHGYVSAPLGAHAGNAGVRVRRPMGRHQTGRGRRHCPQARWDRGRTEQHILGYQPGAAVSSALTLSKGGATDGERRTRMARRKVTSAGAEGMHASQRAMLTNHSMLERPPARAGGMRCALGAQSGTGTSSPRP